MGTSSWRRRVVAVALLLGPLTACGGDRSGGPTGRAEDVVHDAPDITLRQQSARVSVESPEAAAEGRVDFAGGTDTLTVSSRDPRTPLRLEVAAGSRPDVLPPAVRLTELVDPLDAVDAVRGAVDVVPYGGVGIRGASTIRYSFEVDLDLAIAKATTAAHRADFERTKADIGRASFYGDVFVDSKGRIRRVQLPVDRRDKRPGYRQAIIEKVVTVDLFAYEGPAGRG